VFASEGAARAAQQAKVILVYVRYFSNIYFHFYLWAIFRFLSHFNSQTPLELEVMPNYIIL